MISPKKLIKMARKWQKVAASWGKRISVPRIHQGLNADCCSTSSVADKGHFVVYTADRKRFMIPLAYLNTQIFRDLFKMSEEEFGLPSDGPITLLCDSFFMEYIVFLMQRSVAKDLEKALLMSFANTRSSPSFFSHQEQMKPRFLVCSYWIKDSSILQMINSFTSYKNPRALLHISLFQHWKWSNFVGWELPHFFSCISPLCCPHYTIIYQKLLKILHFTIQISSKHYTSSSEWIPSHHQRYEILEKVLFDSAETSDPCPCWL